MVAHGTPSEEEVEGVVSPYARALRESGLRVTHQRLEVAREIACSNKHPDVEAIYRGVRKRVPTISLDTVYRTLGALERLGLIRRMEALGGPARYDANLEDHHHFICTRCGLIRDVSGTSYEGLEAPESAAELGKVESITLQLRGLCRSCQESEERHQSREGLPAVGFARPSGADRSFMTAAKIGRHKVSRPGGEEKEDE